jgi:hypothetical protein
LSQRQSMRTRSIAAARVLIFDHMYESLLESHSAKSTRQIAWTLDCFPAGSDRTSTLVPVVRPAQFMA